MQAHAGPCPTPGRCCSSALALESRGFCIHTGTGTRPERPRALTHLPRAPLLRAADPVSPGTGGCDVSMPPTPAVPLPVMPPWPSDCFPECCPPNPGPENLSPRLSWDGRGQKREPTDLRVVRGHRDQGQAWGVPAGRSGVVRVCLEVQAVNGEDALFLSRKGCGKEETEGQPDCEGHTPSPRAAGRASPRAQPPSTAAPGAAQSPPPITGSASPAPLRRAEGIVRSAPDGHAAAQRC